MLPMAMPCCVNERPAGAAIHAHTHTRVTSGKMCRFHHPLTPHDQTYESSGRGFSTFADRILQYFLTMILPTVVCTAAFSWQPEPVSTARLGGAAVDEWRVYSARIGNSLRRAATCARLTLGRDAPPPLNADARASSASRGLIALARVERLRLGA